MKCFVIMPFGEKTDSDGGIIDFNKIYLHVIKNTVEQLGIKCIRCDEIAESGWIHSKMFDSIYKSEVAVVDITSLNANVFYELGIRHALAEHVTVLIKKKGTNPPFNIQDFSVIEYDLEDFTSVDDARRKISDYIRNGIELRRVDSPVHNILKIRVHTEAIRLSRQDVFDYKIKNSKRRISIITGEIQNAIGVADVWVSSENVNMQMSRHFERSISAVIRYLGAVRSQAGEVVDDLIADELRKVVGNVSAVPPGTVIATSAGELEKSHGVKRIFHAAAVVGMLGAGYSPVPDISACVRRALELMDAQDHTKLNLRSILFPLMGTGTGRGNLEETARKLIDCAISYLTERKSSRIERVFFMALTDRELDACQRVLQSTKEVALA